MGSRYGSLLPKFSNTACMFALSKRLVRSSTKFMKGSLSMFGPAMTEKICFTKGFVGGMWYAACCRVNFPCGWFTLAAKSPYVSV